MGNDGEFRGLVYAPYGNVTTTGSTSDFYGRLIADTITLGNSLTVHIPSEMLLPKDMIDNLPHSNHLIHGDYHTNNIMVLKGINYEKSKHA